MKTMMILSSFLMISAAHADLFDDYTFDHAKDAHDRAIGIQETTREALGEFKLVATASKSYRGEFAKKDINGIRNQDGSMFTMKVEANSDPAGSKMLISQLNLGAAGQNQGPSGAVFDSVQGTMTFAQYAYRAGQLNDDVYFFSECRLMSDRIRLLCAKRFIVNRPDAVNDQQRALHNQIVGYDLYGRL